MNSKFMTVLVGLMVAMIGVVVAPQAAQAAVNGCPDGGYICFYNNANFSTSSGLYVQYAGPINTCRALPTSGASGWPSGRVSNLVSSILLNWTGTNVISRTITFYDAANCSGDAFAASEWPGRLDTSTPNLANIGWNDRLSSFKVN